MDVVQRGANFVPSNVKEIGLGQLRKTSDDNCVQASLNQYCRDIVARQSLVRGDDECANFDQVDSVARFIDKKWRCSPRPTHNSRWLAACVTTKGMTRMCRVENSNDTCTSHLVDDEMRRLVDYHVTNGCTGRTSVHFRDFTLVS